MQALVFEAGLHVVAGRHGQARELLEAACDVVELRPFYEGNAYFLEAGASYVATIGHVSEAARLLGLAKALRDLVGAHIWALLDPMSARIHDTVRSASTVRRSTPPSLRAGRSTLVRVRCAAGLRCASQSLILTTSRQGGLRQLVIGYVA
jgi:hypothetical protein